VPFDMSCFCIRCVISNIHASCRELYVRILLQFNLDVSYEPICFSVTVEIKRLGYVDGNYIPHMHRVFVEKKLFATVKRYREVLTFVQKIYLIREIQEALVFLLHPSCFIKLGADVFFFAVVSL
jgi:hypothetical protein